jgi:tetratricopeptide (TPR) repeat protein
VERVFGVPTYRVLAVVVILVGFPLRSLGVQHPTIQSVLPASGMTTPGMKVAVRGVGFSPGAVVYFDGLESRETNFVSSTELDVVTPYLRPGSHLLQIASGAASVRSSVEFSALPSEVDSEIDRANEMAGQGKIDEAVSILEKVGQTDSDYQVRAAAYYVESQIFFNLGDFVHWRRAADLIYLDAAKSGNSVQKFWGYRLAFSKSHYLLGEEPETGFDLRLADNLIEFDVTRNPEARFYRALLNARFGNLLQAKSDSDFVLHAWPNKPSATALAAYVAALGGNMGPVQALTSGPPLPTDATTLALLGDGLFLSGDSSGANRFWSLAGELSPAAATMAFLAGNKHLKNGQKTTARILFAECAAMAPYSKEGQEAKDVLSNLKE